MHRGEFDELQMSSADTTGCGNLPHSDFLSQLQTMLAYFTNNLAHSILPGSRRGDREVVKPPLTRTQVIGLKLSRKLNMGVWRQQPQVLNTHTKNYYASGKMLT